MDRKCRTCGKELLPTCNKFCTTTCMRKAPMREWKGTRFGCYIIISFHSIIDHVRVYLCTNHKGEECRVSSRSLMHAKTATSDKYKNMRRKNYYNNKAHYVQYRKEYRRKNPQVDDQYERENKVVRVIDRKYRMYRDKDIKRGYDPPDFTMNDLLLRLSVSKCIYCGSIHNLGLDRIDNTMGHTKDNTVVACQRCNVTRSNNFTVDEMKRLGKIIRDIDEQRSTS